MTDAITALLPVLGSSSDPVFNVFDVMHHGVHEKQVSNVFRWLMEVDGTHGFGRAFVDIVIDEIDSELADLTAPLPRGDYWVRQEVNTSTAGDADVADIVLESREATVVIENYFTSDGHGHHFDRYLAFAERHGTRGVVVLLCLDVDHALQTRGWEHAVVLTYRRLIDRLHALLGRDRAYRARHPDAFSFIEQLHRKFGKGRDRVNDDDVLGFMTAMCATGEAVRYRELKQDVAAARFASDLEAQARRRFGEGRELMQRAKSALRAFSAGSLARQLNTTLGEGTITGVSARFSGIYQWTVNFEMEDSSEDFGEARLQLKFGPSAWFANEGDPAWTRRVDPAGADYSRVFITRSRTREIRQTSVSLREVLDGLEPTDRRLHDEIVALLGEPRPDSASQAEAAF